LVDFTAIWYVLLPFGTYLKSLGIFCGRSVYFTDFGMLTQDKSGNPGDKRQKIVPAFLPTNNNCQQMFFFFFFLPSPAMELKKWREKNYRVARFFLVQYTKAGENIPNDKK
jgi:hypothetical protein